MTTPVLLLGTFRYSVDGRRKPVAARGLQRRLELIDEDVATYGNPIAHALARAGNVVYAEEYRA